MRVGVVLLSLLGGFDVRACASEVGGELADASGGFGVGRRAKGRTSVIEWERDVLTVVEVVRV